MKRKKWFIVVAVVVILGSWLIWFRESGTTQSEWKTEVIDRGNIEEIVSASGTLSATNTVEVGTQVSGVISEINVDYNDLVNKGQVLAKIDPRNLKAALDQAKASLTQAEIQVAQKERALDLAERFNSNEISDLSIREAEAALVQVKSQLDLAERNSKRYEDLFKMGVVARIELETIVSEYEQLKANYDAKLISLNRTKANVGSVDLQNSRDEVKLAEANLLSMQAAVIRAKINLDYTTITAPIDGIILSRTIEVGQTVVASFQTPVLFTIANDLTQMEIEASIDEADIGLIKKNLKTRFTVDAYLDEIFEGSVKEIRLQPQIISNVVTYTVIITASNPKVKLMPGMTASIDIIVNKRTDVLRAPVSALNYIPTEGYFDRMTELLVTNEKSIEANNDGIWSVGILWTWDGSKLSPVKINTGLSDEIYTEISTDDLKPGDRVVTGIGQIDKTTNNRQSSPFIPSRSGRRN